MPAAKVTVSTRHRQQSQRLVVKGGDRMLCLQSVQVRIPWFSHNLSLFDWCYEIVNVLYKHV